MHALSANDPVILAGFSGGADSIGLLLHLQREGRRVVAGIVDHGLRPGSAYDAENAAHTAQALSIPVRLARLDWGGKRAGQAAARLARHTALIEMARECGASTIALGHTLSDLAETVVMRVRARTGWRGLAAMPVRAPSPVWPAGEGLWLERPLINQRRDAIRADLAAAGYKWIDDPANLLPQFERVRVRAELADIDPQRFRRVAAAAARRARRVDLATAALFDAFGRFRDGLCFIEREAMDACNSAHARSRLAAVVTTAVAGAARVTPDRAGWALLSRLREARAASLHGATWRRVRHGFEVTRDRGALLGRADGAPGVEALTVPRGTVRVWDGRLAVYAEGDGVILAPDPMRRDGAPRVQTGVSAWRTWEQAVSEGTLTGHWLVETRLRTLLWRTVLTAD